MVTRSERLSQFHTESMPDDGVPVRLLCEDHVGTYLVPFACTRSGGTWTNASTGEALDVQPAGWRHVGPVVPVNSVDAMARAQK